MSILPQYLLFENIFTLYYMYCRVPCLGKHKAQQTKYKIQKIPTKRIILDCVDKTYRKTTPAVY